MKYFYFSLIATTYIYGNGLEELPSFQGFKGIVNTPNAAVYKEGEFEFLYTNQVDDLTPSSSIDYRDNKEQENYFLNMGILPNLDMSIRFANLNKNSDKNTEEIPKSFILRDRIISLKYQIPFIPKDLFQIAVGIQDIGGGAPHLNSKYAVASKEFKNIRASAGYAVGSNAGALNGTFGSVEYQPLNWLNVSGEYDTHDWNAAIKAQYLAKIGKKKINLGLMAKSSADYNDVYFGIYANLPFNDKSQHLELDSKDIPSSISDLKNYGFSNISYHEDNDTIYFEYENTLYTYSDIDALGMVLGTLAMSDKAKNIVVTTKKSDIRQFTTKVNTKEYKEFLSSGVYKSNLLQFSNIEIADTSVKSHSDRFKPTLTLRPDFILIDGSEYSSLDHTLAMQAELSMRLAKGTILSTRYNIPLSISNNFEDGEIFDYRNRNKTKAEIDQVLLSQYFQMDLPYRWVSLLQIGQFDRKLTGASFETGISTLDGKHSLTFKGSRLKDDMYKNMDRYYVENRDEELYSYQYYISNLNSNIKVTAGDFLYGDSGAMISMERYFSDSTVRFDISKTEHIYKGDYKVAKLTLSIPFGTTKKVKTKYLDIQGDYLTYTRRKTVVSNGQTSFSQPHHLKEVDNSFTLDKYYLNNNRMHPSYIKKNYNRLRNVFIGD